MSRLTVNLMTAALSPGDAIGNYILSLRRIFQGWGARVRLFADSVAPDFGAPAAPSSFYEANAAEPGLLWYHYSIYSDNVELARCSADFSIIDYHGITPPALLGKQNPYLAELCRRGIQLLPNLAGEFDRAVVHSSYTEAELIDAGFGADTISTIPLCIDLTHFAAGPDARLAQRLQQLTYFLFVGRIVPQKDLLATLRLFAAVNRRRQDAVLILVGSRNLTPGYQRQLDRFIRQEGLEKRVMWTGQVNNPTLLAALFRHAAFYVVTSEWESFCVPIAEAAYFGTPTVTHALPPLPEVAGPGALIIDKDRPEQAADVVLAALEARVAYAARRAQTAAWAERYTDAALADNVLALLRQTFDV